MAGQSFSEEGTTTHDKNMNHHGNSYREMTRPGRGGAFTKEERRRGNI